MIIKVGTTEEMLTVVKGLVERGLQFTSEETTGNGDWIITLTGGF